MKINRVIAIILRFLFHFRHSLDRVFDSFYWPTIDLVNWGLASTFFTKAAPNTSIFVLFILSGVLFWIIIWRAQYEISINLLDEYWSRNLINLFVSPLKLTEWITGLLILGLIKATMSFAFASFVAFILYKTNIFIYGFYFLPFIFLLFLTGWAFGIFLAGLIFRFGTKIQAFAWALVPLFMPFSAVFYPVSILPGWAQKIAVIVPSSYVFESARDVLTNGTLDWNKLYISFILNIIFIILAIFFLISSYKKALEIGLMKTY